MRGRNRNGFHATEQAADQRRAENAVIHHEANRARTFATMMTTASTKLT